MAIAVAACHPTDQPPVQPPKPTNPTADDPRARAEIVLDASIVIDGSSDWDGGPPLARTAERR